MNVPKSMSFEDAMNVGLIGEISTYTTSYTYGTESTQSRNFNIHRVADFLNNSICPAGGKWSFHGTAGECNEENGFQAAGIINEGEYDTSYGGGICQVATTVFNAVYDAGYYIDRRYPHTLYNPAYPAGRDAAVNWPDLDLIWSNSTDSDVLVTTSHTEGTVTVTLYGVDPEYRVETYTSDFEMGKEYKTVYKVNEELSPMGSRTKVVGQDGRSVYVERTVSDRGGEQLWFQRFNSTYDPTDEVIEVGVDYKIPEDTKDANN